MNKLRLRYPLPLVKEAFKVSASGYYAWQDRPPSLRDREELRLEIEIEAADRRTRAEKTEFLEGIKLCV